MLTVAPDWTDGIVTPSKLQRNSDATNERTPLFARKSIDESVSSASTGTTYQADDHLVVAGADGAIYTAHLHLIVNSGTTPDIKVRVSLPSGATAPNWSLHKSSGPFLISSMATGLGVATVGSDEAFEYFGLIIMSSTAGAITVEWAQNTSDAGLTTVKANSWIRLDRVS